MATATVDEEKRLALVRTLLEEYLHLKVSTITTLGRAFNNYAWTVEVSPGPASLSAATEAATPLQPGTTAIPTDITKVVVRIGNPAAALNESVRAQNEVAAIQLSREACSAYRRKIIPDVYGWRNKSATSEYGWIVEEYMPGEQLLPVFADLPAAAQQDLLNEMASIYKCLTSYRLPSSVKGFGGLGYNEKGEVVTGPIVFDFGGPWATYDEMYEKTMDKQLALADGSPLFNGWRRNGLRERLNKFRAEGMGKILAKVTDRSPTLVHGDFDLINMMFDPTTNTITALLDFDFAHIAGPADELFYSFAQIHGLMTAIFEDSSDRAKLRQFLLGEADLPLSATPPDSSSSSQPANTDETSPGEAEKKKTAAEWQKAPEISWILASQWDTALRTANATRPRDIDGIKDLTTLYWFVQDVCSPFMLMPRWLARFTEEERMEKLAEAEKKLVKYLEYWEF